MTNVATTYYHGDISCKFESIQEFLYIQCVGWILESWMFLIPSVQFFLLPAWLVCYARLSFGRRLLIFDTRQNYRICYISNPDALYNLKLCILQKYSNLIGSISEIPKVSIVILECWVILPCIDQVCITHIYIASSYNILPTQHHEGNQYLIVVRRRIIPLCGVYCNILTYFQALKYIVYDTKWRVMGKR